MRPLYKEALDGALTSISRGGDEVDVWIDNGLAVPIIVYYLDASGQRHSRVRIEPDDRGVVDGAYAGYSYVVTNAFSGGFVCAFKLDWQPSASAVGSEPVTLVYRVDVKPDVLCEPNDIGRYPENGSPDFLPPDTPLVMISSGTVEGVDPDTKTKQTNIITREQYWSLAGQSYCITPGEKRTVSSTITSGRQSTTSAQATVATSVGAATSAGWGPVSASVSAGLSASASLFQQVSINEQSTTFISTVVSNDTGNVLLVLCWQMMDVITVYSPTGKSVASVVSALNPAIFHPVTVNSFAADVD